jgi:hypothetical protein
MRINAVQSFKSVAVGIIDTYEKAVVYQMLSQGNVTQTKIEQTTAVSRSTLSGWLGSFVTAGLCSEPNKFYEGFKALFTLQELGIDSSALKKRTKQKPRAGTTTPAPQEQAGETKVEGVE